MCPLFITLLLVSIRTDALSAIQTELCELNCDRHRPVPYERWNKSSRADEERNAMDQLLDSNLKVKAISSKKTVG